MLSDGILIGSWMLIDSLDKVKDRNRSNIVIKDKREVLLHEQNSLETAMWECDNRKRLGIRRRALQEPLK